MVWTFKENARKQTAIESLNGNQREREEGEDLKSDG
jgi:hypothetical protein